MGKVLRQIAGLCIFFLLVLTFQNCNSTNFSAGGSGSSGDANGRVYQPGYDDAFGQIAQYGLPVATAGSNICYGYADEATGGVCASSLTPSVVFQRLDSNGNVVIRIIFPRTFVDNTYGFNAIGWATSKKGTHTFKDLVGTDHVVVSLFDKSNNLVMTAKMDYISQDPTTGGYATLGVDGGEGAMLAGNRSDVVSVRTSLSVNFNDFGYQLVTDSPATNANYAANSAYPNWIYHVWYEISVKASAFAGGGFGQAKIESIHASPSKIGINTCEVIPVVCE